MVGKLQTTQDLKCFLKVRMVLGSTEEASVRRQVVGGLISFFSNTWLLGSFHLLYTVSFDLNTLLLSSICSQSLSFVKHTQHNMLSLSETKTVLKKSQIKYRKPVDKLLQCTYLAHGIHKRVSRISQNICRGYQLFRVVSRGLVLMIEFWIMFKIICAKIFSSKYSHSFWVILKPLRVRICVSLWRISFFFCFYLMSSVLSVSLPLLFLLLPRPSVPCCLFCRCLSFSSSVSPLNCLSLLCPQSWSIKCCLDTGPHPPCVQASGLCVFEVLEIEFDCLCSSLFSCWINWIETYFVLVILEI